MKKRILSLALALTLCLPLLPTLTLAVETDVPGELPQLAAPTELEWGTLHRSAGVETLPGATSWKVDGACQGKFRLEIYRVGETAPVFTPTTVAPYGDRATYYGDTSFLWGQPFHPLGSGTYYFTVTSKGDGINYLDSECATSDEWTFVAPETQLPAPQSPTWDWPNMRWENPSESGNEQDYFQAIYFSKTADGTPQHVDGVTNSDRILDETIQTYGDGYYYFRVYSTSKDITQYMCSPLSELSPAYYLPSSAEIAKEDLSTILSDETITDVRSEVQKLETETLRSALLADQGEAGGTADLLQQLEEKTGTEVKVATQEGFEAFAGTEIIGAALNDVPPDTSAVTLQIGPAEKENVIPEQYNNTVALSFSMGLEGVANPEALKVPVKITLPIPETINPDFLVILHYAQDGTVREVLRPYIFQKENRWYASFVLTQFSDFVMTDETVATSEVFLNGNRDPGLRNQETNLGDLVADAFLWQAKKSFPDAKIDAAILNGGSIRTSHEAGTLTVNDVKTFLPFDNYVVTVQVTGAELLEILEATTFAAPAADPTFPQVSGVTFTVNTSIPYSKGELYFDTTAHYAPADPGSRVKDVKINGQPLNLESTYTIATNDFAATGGDAFGVLADKVFSDTEVLTMDALAQYLKTELNGTITAAQYGSPAGRITIKTSSGGDSPGGGSHSGGSSSGGSSASSKPTVTIGGDGKGGEVKADWDGSVTITPDEGYQIDKITVNSKAVELPEDGKLTGLKSSDKVEVTFAPIPEPGPAPTPASELYPDVVPGAWYEEAVTFVVDRGLFQGTDQGLFAPDAPMTRAMLLTVLARIEDVEPTNDESWYGGALDWAVKSGISDGSNPETPIAREQLVTMLYRYAGQPETAGDLAAFPDASSVSSFAADAMAWAVATGIINGTDTGLLDPQGQATRAQVAKILQAYLSLPR